MRTHDPSPRSHRHVVAVAAVHSAVVALLLLTARPALADVVDPFQGVPSDPPAKEVAEETARKHAAAKIAKQRGEQQPEVRTANFQTNDETPFSDDPTNDLNAPGAQEKSPKATNDPCAAMPVKAFDQFGINIELPTGRLPTDLAGPCWEQINHNAGGLAAARCWPVLCYQWEATCFCHQPLYFEETNLERYGYQCGERCCSGCECCLQPAASAFHFFGMIPVLPYCMAMDCPGNCNYTLGHYRTGSRNPWRWHWPYFDPIAAAAEGGVWTGLVFAIP